MTMMPKTLFLALAALLMALATSSQAQAWGCAHVSGYRGGYGGGYHASATHYNPATGNVQHVSTGGGGGAYGGYHYGGYTGASAGYARRW
jgi:hypothetical protein